MKLKWKAQAKNEAVSPVIATILMVAITVVLAAVLYVMVIGMGGEAITPTPVGSWRSMTVITNSSASIIFGNFQPEVTPIEIKLLIEDENGNLFNLSFSTSVDSDNYTLSCDNPGIDAFYHDQNYGGNQMGAGDYIMLYGLKPFTNYNVRVFHYPSDSVVEMAGDTSFQTVP